jgi:hypothetical protein
MLLNIMISVFMIFATTIIHTGAMAIVLKWIRLKKGQVKRGLQRAQIYRLGGIVLLMVFTSLVEVLVWAFTYLALNAIEGFERALYFSMASFASLGSGDIVLDERWRLLSSFEAANGIIMFGWTTAIIVSTVHYIFLGNDTE